MRTKICEVLGYGSRQRRDHPGEPGRELLNRALGGSCRVGTRCLSLEVVKSFVVGCGLLPHSFFNRCISAR